jgi:hypothetical protein
MSTRSSATASTHKCRMGFFWCMAQVYKRGAPPTASMTTEPIPSVSGTSLESHAMDDTPRKGEQEV